MPRQPFHPVFVSNGGGTIEFGHTVGQRPELEAIIGNSLIAWPTVEAEMALLLGQLLGIVSEATLAVFQTLRRSTAQRAAVWAAAQHNSDEAGRELIAAVLDVHTAIEKERTALAHGHFGYYDKVPDIILWTNTVSYVQLKAKVFLANVPMTDQHKLELIKEVYFYRREDLEEIHKSIQYCGRMWVDTIVWLKTFPPRRDELFRLLCDQPRIQQALEIRRQKNNPSTRPQSPTPTDDGTE
jgi:hypothetical protein